MKQRYVFCGSLPSHMMGVVSFLAFGQAVQLADAEARDLSKGGSAIARGEEFDAIGFTSPELVKYGPFGAHTGAPAEFTTKRLAAVALAEKLRAEFEAAPEEAA